MSVPMPTNRGALSSKDCQSNANSNSMDTTAAAELSKTILPFDNIQGPSLAVLLLDANTRNSFWQ